MYHLPTAEGIFTKMKGAKYFTTLDPRQDFGKSSWTLLAHN